MKIGTWLWGVVGGCTVGLAVASIVTYMDWRTNPGDIFHDAEHTHWAVVWDTAISWFLPVGAIATVFALVVLYTLSRRH